MRLHRLEITAFGPFAETSTVDFDELGADGLFLLHGNTGAGKTTVLDAIAFALYGTVPGARQEAKRLLSDHAPAGSRPEVKLEATIGGRRLRMIRSPEYQRPKLRGTGMRVENAKATLTWLDGRGQNLTRINEIGDEVNRLLGMSADQFFQVVLLPQGEFARFLRADNDNREKLLERLFDTERFATAEQWLSTRRRDSAAQFQGQRIAIDRLVSQVSTAADVQVAEADPIEWAQDLLDGARVDRTVRDATLTTAKAAAEGAIAALESARRDDDLRRRMRVAQDQLDRQIADRPRLAELADELDSARRAGPIAAAIVDADEAARAAGDATAGVHDATAALSVIAGGEVLAAQIGWPAAMADRQALEDAISAWTAEVGKLDDVLDDAHTADALAADVERLRNERARLESAAAALTAERADLPARTRAVEAALTESAGGAATIAGLEKERDRAADAADAAVELAARRKKLATAQKRLEDRRSTYADARERTLDIRELRLAGMAAELAAGLSNGDACQVCGSTEHPSRATPSEASVTKADEDAAVAAERRAGADRDGAVAAVATLESGIAALVQRGGDRHRAELVAELDGATTALAAAVAAAERVDRLTGELETLRTDDARLTESLRTTDQRLSSITERISATTERVTELQARVVAAAGGDTSVEVRRRRLRALAQQCGRLRDVRAAAVSAEQQADDRRVRADTITADAGFADRAAVASAARPQRRMAEIGAALTKANEITSHAEAVLSDPEIVAVREREPADMSVLLDISESARDALESAVAEHAHAVRRLGQLEELVAQLWAAVDRLAPMQAKHQELETVAELVAGRGQNTRKMSLRSYVLAARLEEVAAAGSARLRQMSAGRYEFVHSDAAGPRGKRGGLGLEIRDDYTGSNRPAKTLSGGETFVASLALALGLADVVAAESGGLVLDTMFIDEGFGGLDSDALDSVMGVLDELRAGGRVVGVVSHVDEMRQRIPSRLHVIRGRAGSRLETRVAG